MNKIAIDNIVELCEHAKLMKGIIADRSAKVDKALSALIASATLLDAGKPLAGANAAKTALADYEEARKAIRSLVWQCNEVPHGGGGHMRPNIHRIWHIARRQLANRDGRVS